MSLVKQNCALEIWFPVSHKFPNEFGNTFCFSSVTFVAETMSSGLPTFVKHGKNATMFTKQ
jgi:hypothetical protein